MIVTNGQLKRRHVYDVKLGDKSSASKCHQAKKVMYNGHVIWPEPKREIARITLDPEGLADKKDFAVWRAARELYLVRDKDPEKCFMGISNRIDGYSYVFNKNNLMPDGIVVRYQYVEGGADTIDFMMSDRRPPAELIKVGDELTIKVRVEGIEMRARLTSHSGDDLSFFNVGWVYSYQGHAGRFATGRCGYQGIEKDDSEWGTLYETYWDLPPSEYVWVYSGIYKYQKKKNVDGYCRVFALPSNNELYKHSYWNHGHNRRSSTKSEVLKYVKGSKGMNAWMKKANEGRDNGHPWTVFDMFLGIKPMDVLVKVKVGKVETVDVYE